MTRLEENKMIINESIERGKNKPIRTYKELTAFNLGTISIMLTDISKSLAIIADKMEREEK